jgi:hypothetical protein
MCSATRWLTKGAFIALALCLFLQGRTTLAEDSLWQKAITEGKQLRQQGHYAEAERAYLLALAEAEKFGPEDPRQAMTLNNLAARNEFVSLWRLLPP